MTSKLDAYYEVQKRAFVATNNPMYAWAAYSRARLIGDEIPEWVLKYLDFSARALLELSAQTQETLEKTSKGGKIRKAKRGAKDIGPRVAAALKLSSKGAGTALSSYHSDWELYGLLVRHFRQNHVGETNAIEEIAGDKGVSASTIRAAYKLYDKLFPGNELFAEDAVKEKVGD